MIWNKCVRGYCRWALIGLGLIAASSISVRVMAQDSFRPTPRNDRPLDYRDQRDTRDQRDLQDPRDQRDQRDPRDYRDTRDLRDPRDSRYRNDRDDTRYNDNRGVSSLSEATALLESAVRTMYKTIEPGQDDASPNELLAYADLRALRLYTGALEVAGWSLEQTAADHQQYEASGAYRGGYRNVTDQQALVASEKYRAYRETARTLLYRVRETAVSVEHQVSYCDPAVAREWRQNVLPALRDTIGATEPMFHEQPVYQGYGIPGQTVSRIVPAGGTSGVPREAVDVNKSPTYQPYNGQGQGQGRYFEVRAFGGAVRVRAIRFRTQETAFGVLGTSATRELAVDQIAEPGRPLFIPGNRGRWVNVSDVQVDWESADRDRRAYGTIELAESSPDDSN